MDQDFRVVLKERTRQHHARLDRSMSELDLSTASGLATFLQIHALCFAELRVAVECDIRLQRQLDDLIVSARTDLATLGREEPPRVVFKLGALDPLAVEYVVEGSRLGTRVLKRRWQTSHDDRVRRASAYFSRPAVPNAWRDVCERLSDIPTEDVRAERVIVETCAIFDLFETVAGAMKDNAMTEDLVLP